MAETDSAPDTASTPSQPALFDEEAFLEERLSGGDPDEHPLSERAVAAKAAKLANGAAPAEEQPEQPEQQAEPALAPDVAAELADARLRPVQGETTEQALRRLSKHYSGRSRSHYEDLRGLKEELGGVKQMIQPLWQALRDQAEAQQREAFMRQVPDKEADPQAYHTWLLEQTVQRQEEERQRNEEQAAQLAQQEQLVAVDEVALTDLVTGLESDGEVRDGYSFALQVGMKSAEKQFPNATPEQLEELAKLSQQLMMRGLVHHGASVSDYYRHMYATARSLIGGNGGGTQAQQQQAAAVVAEAMPQPMPQVAPAPAQPQGSPTAARLRAESAKAAARAVVSPGPAASSTPSGEGIDLRQLNDEQAFELYQEYAAAGRTDQWERMIQEQFGVSRR